MYVYIILWNLKNSKCYTYLPKKKKKTNTRRRIQETGWQASSQYLQTLWSKSTQKAFLSIGKKRSQSFVLVNSKQQKSIECSEKIPYGMCHMDAQPISKRCVSKAIASFHSSFVKVRCLICYHVVSCKNIIE